MDKNERINTLDDYLNGSAVVEGRAFSTFYSYEFDGLTKRRECPRSNIGYCFRGCRKPERFLGESGEFIPDFSGD